MGSTEIDHYFLLRHPPPHPTPTTHADISNVGCDMLVQCEQSQAQIVAMYCFINTAVSVSPMIHSKKKAMIVFMTQQVNHFVKPIHQLHNRCF